MPSISKFYHYIYTVYKFSIKGTWVTWVESRTAGMDPESPGGGGGGGAGGNEGGGGGGGADGTSPVK